MTIKEALPIINTGIIAFFMVLFGLQYNQNKNLKVSIQNLQGKLDGKEDALSEEERDLIDCLKYEDCFAYNVNGNKLNRNNLDYYMDSYSFTNTKDSNENLNNNLQEVCPLKDGYKYEYNENNDDKKLYIRDRIHFRRGGIKAVADKFVIKNADDEIVSNDDFDEILKGDDD